MTHTEQLGDALDLDMRSWFVPDVNDEVLVVFEGGDTRRPYVVGGLWNGSDAAPESMDGGGNNYKKVLRSRNGVKVTLDDQDGQEAEGDRRHDESDQPCGFVGGREGA